VKAYALGNQGRAERTEGLEWCGVYSKELGGGGTEALGRWCQILGGTQKNRQRRRRGEVVAPENALRVSLTTLRKKKKKRRASTWRYPDLARRSKRGGGTNGVKSSADSCVTHLIVGERTPRHRQRRKGNSKGGRKSHTGKLIGGVL